MKVPLLLIPGLTGADPDHWQALWERKYPAARRVHMPDFNRPERQAWVAALDQAIRSCKLPPVLVAHGCGVAATVHWAASQNARIHSAMLVAPSDTENPKYPREARTFHPLPQRRLGFSSVLVASSDDPYCTTERARQLANAWGSRYVEVGPLGHINTESGHGSWPEGEVVLSEILEEVTIIQLP